MTFQKLSVLLGITMLFTCAASFALAQEGSTFSGRVVDEKGNPVVGMPIEIQPSDFPVHQHEIEVEGIEIEGFLPILARETGLQGSFSITDIPPVSVRLVVGDDERETEVLSVDIGNLTLYPNDHPHFNEMRFSLSPGTTIEDAVIKVKTQIQPQVRARVVYADGMPIANAQIRYIFRRRDLDETGRGSSWGTLYTDAEGYFLEDLRVDDEPQFYVIGVEYEGFLAKSLPFILHEGQPEVHLLLKMGEQAIPIEEHDPERMETELDAFLNPPPVWAVNSTNGHAYKKIYCHSIEDAIAKATAEKAFLVSINDRAEEEWIRQISGGTDFLIGLSDAAEEGKWVWHSGEPVTYTNWTKYADEADGDSEGGNTDMKDYVIAGFGFGGGWRAVGPGDRHSRSTKVVIIEKPSQPIQKPADSK